MRTILYGNLTLNHRLYGIDFTSVLTRGSQYRVEASLLKKAHAFEYLLITPSRKRVAAQAPMVKRKFCT